MINKVGRVSISHSINIIITSSNVYDTVNKRRSVCHFQGPSCVTAPSIDLRGFVHPIHRLNVKQINTDHLCKFKGTQIMYKQYSVRHSSLLFLT